MQIGFIGAGKMGFTLGKHFAEHGRLPVAGYYSKNLESARLAAEFTDTNYYDDLEKLVLDSDILFITVPDGQIQTVAETLDCLDAGLEGKILCHTSGAFSSQVFSGMHSRIFGYSIHPIYAVHSKTASYINFSDCFITIEGHERYMEELSAMFTSLGHSVRVISAADKVKYHSAAVFASNLVIGLYHMGVGLLAECGFTPEEAEQALIPLFVNNAENLASEGCGKALTGPVARCDRDTVEKHLNVLSGDALLVYGCLSRELSHIAEEQAAGRLCETDAESLWQVHESYDALRKLIADKIGTGI